jgi:hypothetical protein
MEQICFFHCHLDQHLWWWSNEMAVRRNVKIFRFWRQFALIIRPHFLTCPFFSIWTFAANIALTIYTIEPKSWFLLSLYRTHYSPLLQDLLELLKEPGSSGSIVSDYGLDDRAIGVRSPVGAKDLSSVSRPALRPTQPPVQWAPGVLSPGVKHGQGVTLTTHPHLMPRSRMSRSYISSPPKLLHGV